MIEFGHYALGLGLCLSLYAFLAGSLSAWKGRHGLALSGRNALIGVNVCVAIASFALWSAIFAHDFSVKYVFRHSAVDMPPVYLFTSFWSALEGSHLLWTLILTSVASVFLLTIRPANAHYLPTLVLSTAIPHSFMLLLNVWESAPLARQFPVGQFGSGMNALLQNPYMAAHPPTLFLGYCCLLVPFSYGAAALFRGRVTPDWIITLRRWTLFGWAVLGTGIFLGGKWAYVELGWAGYWAWDPVENSSFMPWLCATASLHNILVLDKTRKLPRLTIFLGMLAFALTFLGTFITRSGVISSVHSFAESNIGPAYLSFVVLLLLFSAALITFRGSLLVREEAEDGWRLSKEAGLLFTNFFLLFLLALVLVGTLLPLIVEATRGVRISIQQPFFNAFAPWVGVGLVACLGVGNLMKWKTGRIDDPLLTLAFPALWSTVLTAALYVQKDLDVASTIGFWLVLWSMGVLVMDLVYRLKALRWNSKILWKFNRPYIGAWVIHTGFLVAIAGFLGSYRGIEATTTLDLNESANFYDYTLTNRGLRTEEGSNYTFVYAQIEATDGQGRSVMVEPKRSKYTNSEEWLNEIGVFSTVWHDLYLILNSFEFREQQATLRMNINPTVKLVWASIVIMVIGALLGLSHRLKRRSVQVDDKGNETLLSPLDALLASEGPGRGSIAGSLATILLGLAICAVGMSSAVALAYTESGETASQSQTPSPEAVDPPAAVPTSTLSETSPDKSPQVFRLNKELIEVGKDLRCPTCQNSSIIDSDSDQSRAMKKEIERQLADGKSREEILSYFKDRYGEWILREPDAGSGMGLIIWGLPISAMVIGPLALIFALGRKRRRDAEEREALVAEIKAYLETTKA